MGESTTAPGWYPDPGGTGQRYHDGSWWTEHCAPDPTPEPDGDRFRRFINEHHKALTALLFIGFFAGVTTSWWVPPGIAVVWLTVWGVMAAVRAAKTARAESVRRAQVLADHADDEHRMWMSDDPRGFYGHFPPAV